MESNMVDKKFIHPLESIAMVENYFKKNVPKYQFVDKGNYAGYWWITYNFDDIKINFDGDIGGVFHIYIYIDEKEYPLWQYDKSVNNKTATNSENIAYQLNIMSELVNSLST